MNIISSGEMVKAILDGRKTQTRRPINPQPECQLYEPVFDGQFWQWHSDCDESETPNGIDRKCPYGQPGDRLWVRETFAIMVEEHDEYPFDIHGVAYKATDISAEPDKWIPSIYMPRWASRITLEVVDVRVERLRDISEHDAIKEGFIPQGHSLALAYFIKFWNSLYTKNPEYQWQANPWVWVIEFKVIK